MKTKDLSRLSIEEYKRQTQMHWGTSPCGSNYSDKMFLTKDFFEEIENHRYRSHPWILEAIKRFNINGKKVLEIGYGMGTDHLQMAKRGGLMYGLDLTPESYEVTKKRIEIYNFHSELTIGDGEYLPYPDNHFDFFYSFGVIHHTPDTEKIVSEIHRVLKPGAGCYITVYNKNSVFFWWNIYIINYLVKGGRKKRTLEKQLSLAEYPNTNENMVVKLYTSKEIGSLFGLFRQVNHYVRHLLPVDIAIFSRFFRDPYKPVSFLDGIGTQLGWYIVIEATK